MRALGGLRAVSLGTLIASRARQFRTAAAATTPGCRRAAPVRGSGGVSALPAPCRRASTHWNAWPVRRRQLHSVAASAAAAPAAEGEGQPQDAGSEQQLLAVNWKVGIALAGASFEAYNELSTEGIPQRYENGAEVHFIDGDFLREKMAGLLRVTIRAATNLTETDSGLLPRVIGGYNDPMCSLSIGCSTYQTQSALRSQDEVEEPEICTLFVRCGARAVGGCVAARLCGLQRVGAPPALQLQLDAGCDPQGVPHSGLWAYPDTAPPPTLLPACCCRAGTPRPRC
jgi:hypothetical protein